MPLNNSGPISLAGSTVGQSIAVELNLSATAQISLNDTAVRNLAGVPSGAIVMPTNFYGKSSEIFYVTFLTPPAGEIGGDYNLTAAPNGAFASLYRQNTGSTSFAAAFRLNASGTVSWSNIQDTSQAAVGDQDAVTSDGAGNIYTTVQAFSANGWITRFNSAGTPTYLTRITNAPGRGIRYNASNDRLVWFGGNTSGSTVIAILSTAGAVISGHTYSGQGFNRGFINSSGNIYFIGDSGSQRRAIRLNSAGGSPFAIFASTSAGSLTEGVISADSSGNIYANGGQFRTAVKFNSSGAVQWQYGFRTPGGSDLGIAAVVVDSALNVYVLTQPFGETSTYLKFNSAGTLQFQRNLTTSLGINSIRMVLSNDNALFLQTRVSVSGRSFVLRLPTNGNGSGTYSVGGQSVTISAGDRTIVTTTHTYSTETPSISDTTITLSPGSAPAYPANSLTASTTTI